MIDAPDLLVRTPLPYHFESLLGYMLRVTEENGYSSPVEIAQLAGMSPHHVDSRQLPVRKLAPIVGLAATALDRYSYLTDPEDPKSNLKLHEHDLGQEARQHFRLCTHPKICPLCINEEGYIDLFWDLSVAMACPKHLITPLFKCQECNRKIDWKRPGLLICKCGANYLEASLEKAESITIEWMKVIYAKTHNESILGLAQSSGFPLKKFEGMNLGQLLNMLHFFTISLGGCTVKLYSDNHEYIKNMIRCSYDIFSDWPNGFIEYMHGDNKFEYSTKLSQYFWKKFKGLYRGLIESSWFNGRCNFILDELINFGLHSMRGSLDGLLKLKPLANNPVSIPLGKRLYIDKLSPESLTRLIQLKHILPLMIAARYLGLPQKVLALLDKNGILNKFGIQECYKTKGYEWNIEELKGINLAALRLVNLDITERNRPRSFIRLGKLLERHNLATAIKAMIVRDVLDHKLVVYGSNGSNLGGVTLDADELARYIFHRRPMSDDATISPAAVNVRIGGPKSLIYPLIYLGFLMPFKSAVGLKIMADSFELFDENFIGEDSLVKLLNLGREAVIQRIELKEIPMLTIPVKDRPFGYIFIPKGSMERLASC